MRARPGLTALFTALWLLVGCSGADQAPGTLSETPRPTNATPSPERAGKRILFGDLHVHTTYSLDAFFTSMPLLGGEGTHPPADACDFARHCAGLDFFSITDHAQELTPEHWAAEKDMVRQCQAVAGDTDDPDLVVFHGFEWTQIGRHPEAHFGHKNVIFRDLEDDRVPARPIAAIGEERVNPWHDIAPALRVVRFLDPLYWRDYSDFLWKFDQLQALPFCEEGVDTRELPIDCMEKAPTPADLFRKLDEWGFPSLVIPHGNAWGSYTPPAVSWDKQLTEGNHDPDRQRLVEVMSGHGNSERYQRWREFAVDENGEKSCPAPTDDYLPCCWQAGEIMRARCGDLPEAECNERIERAKRLTMDAGTAVDSVFPGTTSADWLDCGQARGEFKPAYGFRPRGSAQYALSLSRPGAPGEPPERFRFGLIASSDTHTARPASGFKPVGRKQGRTDMVGPRNAFLARVMDRRGTPEDPQVPEVSDGQIAGPLQIERIGSFLYPGGLVAVHAEGSGRSAIWSALERREVYGTSGPRILLWFDLLRGEVAPLPMGSEVRLTAEPRFRVQATGSFVQKPGCPADAISTLSPERIDQLCLGECYFPSDRRHPIAAIEVIRIRPQRTPDEHVDLLVEDPWRRFECEDTGEGCTVEFGDPEFEASGRDAVYYARALQAPTPSINGDTLRRRLDENGRPMLTPCAVGALDPGDDCEALVQERAWSSPIFVDQAVREAQHEEEG